MKKIKCRPTAKTRDAAVVWDDSVTLCSSHLPVSSLKHHFSMRRRHTQQTYDHSKLSIATAAAVQHTKQKQLDFYSHIHYSMLYSERQRTANCSHPRKKNVLIYFHQFLPVRKGCALVHISCCDDHHIMRSEMQSISELML